LKVTFSDDGWDDYLYWSRHDSKVHERLNLLIEECRRNPFKGTGKPELLKEDLSGWWSRRITGEHRLIYRVEGKVNLDQGITIIQCRYHY
jgi:toxin YoeB